MNALSPIFCRECGAQGECPDLVPYLVTGTEGKFIHVWLHERCSEPWHAKWRTWRQSGSKVAA